MRTSKGGLWLALSAGVAGCAGTAAAQSLTQVGIGTAWGFTADGSTVVAVAFNGDVVLFSGGNTTSLGQVNVGGFTDISADGSRVSATLNGPTANTDEAAAWDGTSWSFLGGVNGACGSLSTAYAMSNDGTTIVGLGWDGCFGRAFYHTTSTGMVALPHTNMGAGGGGRATGVNDDGSVVVGFDHHPTQGQRRAARWINGVLDVIDPNGASELYSCNSDGSVAVGSIGNGALRWTQAGGIQNLGNLPGTGGLGSGCTLQRTSADGSVCVGTNFFSGGPFGNWAPVLWTPTLGLVNLETYIVNVLGLSIPAGVDLRAAVDVSPDGSKILLQGRTTLADQRAFVLDLGTACYADCDGNGTLNIFDYICFGQAYAAQQSYADCDNSGSFNIFDYICFGQAYSAGCP